MSSFGGWLRFLHYFRFNPLLGILLLRDEYRGERKYGLRTTDFIRPDRKSIKGPAREDAFSYMPSNYTLLEQCFARLASCRGNGSFLDMGAGRGRAMIVAAHFGYTELWGVEIDARHAAAAQALWERQAFSNIPFRMHCTDAAHFRIPDHIQTIFFYNPFRETVMEMVIARLMSSYRRAPREMYIIYFNPLYLEQFTAAGFSVMETLTRFRYVKGVLLWRKP